MEFYPVCLEMTFISEEFCLKMIKVIIAAEE